MLLSTSELFLSLAPLCGEALLYLLFPLNTEPWQVKLQMAPSLHSLSGRRPTPLRTWKVLPEARSEGQHVQWRLVVLETGCWLSQLWEEPTQLPAAQERNEHRLPSGGQVRL